jgi:hypothetical protein
VTDELKSKKDEEEEAMIKLLSQGDPYLAWKIRRQNQQLRMTVTLSGLYCIVFSAAAVVAAAFGILAVWM